MIDFSCAFDIHEEQLPDASSSDGGGASASSGGLFAVSKLVNSLSNAAVAYVGRRDRHENAVTMLEEIQSLLNQLRENESITAAGLSIFNKAESTLTSAVEEVRGLGEEDVTLRSDSGVSGDADRSGSPASSDSS